MPFQPGCAVFALDNRPKQKRQRRKIAPGASDSVKTNETQRPGQSSRSSRRATDNKYLTPGTSSALGSTSSSSSSGVGPIRSSRGKRARKQGEGTSGIGTHYDNWTEGRRSPASTDGTAPKTPQSWGSPVSAISPAGRRNAVSEGPFSAASVVTPELFVSNAASGDQSASSIRTIHGRYHVLEEYPEPQSFANDNDFLTGRQPTLRQQNFSHSLTSTLDAPYPTGLAAHAFGQPGVSAAHSANASSSFWAGAAPTVNLAQHLLHDHSQAADCFPSNLFNSVTALPCPSELDPLLFTQAEHHVPGGYPSPPGTDARVFAQEIPGMHAQDLNHDVSTMMLAYSRSSGSYDGSYMHFSPPHE
ncbi:hypothetical protein FRC09_002269 [Ceratobasidium sp. 395]|nr:hypothetical protein FRC09_002269 [Ceratobasidium sp. 395]